MPVDILMPADAEASLPMLIEFVKQAITGERRTVFEQRGAARRKAYAQARAEHAAAGGAGLGRIADHASPG